MIQKQTNIRIIDNSGVKLTKCIQIYKKKVAQIGDTILVSVRQVQKKHVSTRSTINKGELFKAFVIRTKSKKRNLTNTYNSFDENSAILINTQGQPVGTRILGPVPLFLRNHKKFKIMSLGSIFV